MVMKKFRSYLPPLDYLLFFEAAARHGNFTRAADELNVSQAAVSKRIKSLESQLNLELVTRNGPSISLTPTGHKLAASTTEALDFLNSSLTQIRQTNPDRLSLAANVAISQFWLTPRVNDYLITRNAVPITLTTSDRDSDLFRPENDVIIYYSTDIPRGWDGAILFDEVWLPVAAPGLITPGSEIAAQTLLDFEKLTPKWFNWQDFIGLNEHSEFAGAERVKLGSYGSSLDAALRGKGLALGCPDVLHYEIEANRLVPLTEYQIKTGRSYFVVWKPGHMTNRIRDLLSEIEISF